MSEPTEPTEQRRRHCLECATGYYEATARAGRTTPYKCLPAIELSPDLVLLECAHCGSLLIGAKEAELLDEYLEAEYRRRVP